MSNDDKNPPYHKPLIVNGQLYDFCHLEPFIFQFSDDVNERSIEYTINVRFSNHCFSKKIDDVQTDGTIIWDDKQKRCFEPDRYLRDPLIFYFWMPLNDLFDDIDHQKPAYRLLQPSESCRAPQP